MQALSGAGYPGVASLDIIDNVVPFISGEEEKMEAEALKILGTFNGKVVQNADFKLSASCNRVHVKDGHLESSLRKARQKTLRLKQIEAAFARLQGRTAKAQVALCSSEPNRCSA